LSIKGKILDFLFANILSDRLKYRIYASYYGHYVHPWLEYPFYFLHVPKCAGVSIAKALDMPDPGHQLISELSENDQKQLEGKACICAVRDPVARLFSTYKYSQKLQAKHQFSNLSDISKMQDLDHFVRIFAENGRLDTHYFLRPASQFILSALENRMPVLVFNLDHLDDAVREVAKQHNVEAGPIQRLNVSSSSDPVTLSDRSKSIVDRVYTYDFILTKIAAKQPIWIKDINQYYQMVRQIHVSPEETQFPIQSKDKPC
jgi:hypothetical protein